MTIEDKNKLDEMYQNYQTIIKPLIIFAEKRSKKFLPAIINEIRAYNDHIARCYYYSEQEKICKQLEKANSHLKRIILDLHKYLIHYHSKNYNKYNNAFYSNAFIRINKGEFYSKYLKLTSKSNNLRLRAKKKEWTSIETNFNLYQDAFTSCIEIEKYINSNKRKIKLSCILNVIKSISNILIWFALLCVANFVANNITDILNLL